MTVKVQRVRVTSAQVRQLQRSERVQAILARKGEAVAQAVRAASAGIRVEGVPGRVELPVTATLVVGRERARARVYLDHPSGIAVEAKHGVLTASIDAARGA